MLKALVQCACRKAHYPANWVHNWSKKPFCKKSCAPPLLMAGIESGDRKEKYRNFYRNFTPIFLGLGDRNSPPPPNRGGDAQDSNIWH